MKSGAEPRAPLEMRGAGLFDRVDYRLIETPEERDQVYEMRYRAYLHGGLISPSASHRIVDSYDESPNAWIFGIYLDGELCSSLRLHVLTPEQRMSYTSELFGDVLHPRLDRGEVFVDPARFAADPEKSQRFHELPYLTLRLAYLACDHFKADLGLAMVRTDHQAFYRRVFLHETLTEPRPFPGWHSRQVVLMASDFAKLRERVLTRFPIMRSSAFERRMLFDRVGQRQAASRPTLVAAPLSPA
ncbi:hypothetical protein JJB99_08330 [Bradyrhizobium diazoefficiens]|uniref:N-acyl amino acid synthase FeeM domain-containing protein n=1 Tax=Bradyrhizobium diazoefficiens TaxID=1355477 RepID=UPI001909C93C|nr:hypothetical protein [Bradyrhizobium diazoefficiens]QQO16142.1 hypothetical protein JJB99_08330 [Bradyrhizobium diazoefficiens]